MSSSFGDDEVANPSHNRHISTIAETGLSRRSLLKAAGAWSAISVLPLAGCATVAPSRGILGFQGLAVSTADAVRVPPGYTAVPFYLWGDPVGSPSGSPAFRPDARNTAAEQALQAGMHHDGIHYFPLPLGSASSTRGLLAMNHEYTDDGLLHADGFANWSAEKVQKAQNAHGCSVIEIVLQGGRWQVVRPSPYARRISAATPMRVSGPAAGSVSMRTAADPSGREVLGTFNNCADGATPWGTYLTCEENFDGYFVNTGTLTAEHRRTGIAPKGRGYRWHEYDERFDAGRHPNEPHRHGWVVEFDPYDPASVPVKRTALGRFSHEGACTALATDGRLVVYMGDDRAFEYIYKFVSDGTVNLKDRGANRDLLDRGTLYVARFNDDATGEWLPLTQGVGALTTQAGFVDQADVLIRTRAAADALGATKWIDLSGSLSTRVQRRCTARSRTTQAAAWTRPLA